MKFADFYYIQNFKESIHWAKELLVESSSHGFKRTLSTEDYKGVYNIVEGLVDGKKFGCEDFTVKFCYDKNGQYLGDPQMVKLLVDKYKIRQFEKINEDSNICTVGYSPYFKTYAGWSNRGINEFTIGSKVKLGDIAFVPSNKDEHLESLKRWYQDNLYKNVNIAENPKGYSISYDIKQKDGIDSHIESFEPFRKHYGKGEWEAKTLKDAKKMAIDYARNIS